MNEPVRVEARGSLAIITLNRAGNRNSMTAELLDGFADAVKQTRAMHPRAVVITGSGNCFSAGADFKSMIQRDGDGDTTTPHEKSFAMYQPFLSVLDIQVPVIAALNGHAVGGGFGLALCCDIRIGAKNARYGANFVRLGLHPGMAISYVLPRLIGISRAADMLFTGRLVDGVEAEKMGILSAALDEKDVLPRAIEIAESIAQAAPAAVRETKRSLYRHMDWNPRGAAYAEAFAQAESLSTQDAAEGIAALLEKREPVFTGR